MRATSKVGRLVEAGDWPALAALVRRRFGTEVSAATLAGSCLRAFGRRGPGRETEGWSDGSWVSWLKNRVCGAREFDAGGAMPAAVLLTTRLHVGFLSILETEEMLARLPEKATAPDSTARSRLPKSPLWISPVDRTASLVAGGSPGKNVAAE